MDIALKMALGKAQALYADVVSNELVMIKLKVTLNGIIEGLISFQNLSLEGPGKIIDSILLAIEGAEEAMKRVKARGFFWKYAKGSMDK